MFEELYLITRYKRQAKFLKNDFWFGKWHEEFGKLASEHFKVSRLVLSWDPFVQSRKLMSQKFTKELCVITLKYDEKSEEELTYYFKINIRNFTNFDSRTQKYQEFTL